MLKRGPNVQCRALGHSTGDFFVSRFYSIYKGKLPLIGEIALKQFWWSGGTGSPHRLAYSATPYFSSFFSNKSWL